MAHQLGPKEAAANQSKSLGNQNRKLRAVYHRMLNFVCSKIKIFNSDDRPELGPELLTTNITWADTVINFIFATSRSWHKENAILTITSRYRDRYLVSSDRHRSK